MAVASVNRDQVAHQQTAAGKVRVKSGLFERALSALVGLGFFQGRREAWPSSESPGAFHGMTPWGRAGSISFHSGKFTPQPLVASFMVKTS